MADDGVERGACSEWFGQVSVVRPVTWVVLEPRYGGIHRFGRWHRFVR
jgi:hypothetical protein